MNEIHYLLARPNVVYLLGNHDYMMLLVLRKLCGCVFGGSLAAYCVETGEVIYVGSKGNFWGR